MADRFFAPTYAFPCRFLQGLIGPVGYMKRRAVDDGYCRKMIVDYLKINGVAGRREIDDLLLDKLSPELSNQQKCR